MNNKAEAQHVLVSNLLAARRNIQHARNLLSIARPGGGSISDLGSMEHNLTEMLKMVEEMQEARER